MPWSRLLADAMHKSAHSGPGLVQRSFFSFSLNIIFSTVNRSEAHFHDTKNVVFELCYHTPDYFDCGAGWLPTPTTIRFIRTGSPATTPTTNYVRTNDG